MSQAFQVTSIDTNTLPSGWYFRNGYFELEKGSVTTGKSVLDV